MPQMTRGRSTSILPDDQRAAEGEQHDGQRESSDAKGDRETLGDAATDRSEGAALRPGHRTRR